MAADDDLDALESQLEDFDEDDDDDLPKWKVIWKRFMPLILAGLAFIIFIPIVLIASSGSDTKQPKVMVIPELAPEAGKIKVKPETAEGGEVPGTDKMAYNVVTDGPNEGKIVITAPPEDPKAPETAATDDGKKAEPAAIPIAPESGEVSAKDDKTAKDNGAMPAPTPPTGESAALPAVPLPGTAGGDGAAKPAADSGKPAESLLPDVKIPEPQPPAAVATPAPPPKPTDKVPTKDAQVAAVVPVPMPSAKTSGGSSDVTPMRTMAGVYRVQVASTRSEAQAQKFWNISVKQNPDILGKLPLTVQRAVVKDRGTFYRVQGGEFKDRESADNVCRSLKARGQDCLVVRP